MLEQHHFYQQLVKRYAANQATSEELEVFFHLLEQGKLDAALEMYMNEAAGLTEAPPYAEEPSEAVITPLYTKRKLLYRVAAAAVILILAGSAWWFMNRINEPAHPGELAVQQDILPGVSGATLTLEDGSVMQLDTAARTLQVTQGETSLLAGKGTLTYRGAPEAGNLRYNVLTTHKGEQYRITLSDGTKILADAATSLRFPVAFTGRERVVEINGHAWFEVAENARQPFYVKKGNQLVQVLGTSFDMLAYDNEKNMAVTLVTGRVQVNNGKAVCRLAPGQQAIAAKGAEGITLIKEADIEAATAWINGKMVFRNADIATIMRAAERWYNIEVEVQGNLTGRSFYFAVNRTAPLSELLHFLEIYHIKYKLDTVTRKLILMQ
ncbi:ferric-dicitrate binding protein FerR (iron transport regulator) [Filimonas zeae]|uniref:FecR family protein n=1 Tax=Filimonas zeae TaxID=1737353 RepID=A0A917MSF6_9BACT|nr:FecR family protein [Filimonas zeae]MDR6338061.1 ferric-dicitrate binding protein FerR (iron transport regulator) [Filimonas zeae]GGH61524.1 hypothetical protein GCM10011379_10590 [Filimonas zeae]